MCLSFLVMRSSRWCATGDRTPSADLPEPATSTCLSRVLYTPVQLAHLVILMLLHCIQ